MEKTQSLCEPELSARESGFLRTALTGFLIGIGAIAPGISGGAIAVVFGLYARITDALAHLTRDFKKNLKFLAPLCTGAGLAVLLFSQVIAWLFANYNMPVRLLFVGLMAGTLPSVFHTANRQGFRWWYLLPMLAAAAGTVYLTCGPVFVYTGGNAGLNFPLLLLCGGVLGFGTIVPGVSSSFLLMGVGLYEPVLEVIRTVDIPRLLPLGLGFFAFIFLFAKLIDWLYRKAYGFVSYLVAGLLLGSVFPVIPPLRWDGAAAAAILLAAAGGALSWYLLHLQIRKEEKAGC